MLYKCNMREVDRERMKDIIAYSKLWVILNEEKYWTC